MNSFPFSYFAFPLNAIFALIWVFLLWILYKERRTSALTGFLVSSRTSIVCILLLIGGSLVIGLFPQLTEAEAAARTGIAARLGCYNFMNSWLFVGILFLFLSNLGMVTIQAYYQRKKARKRFLLNHAGLWIALFAGFTGSADVQTLRIPLHTDTPSRQAYDMSGAVHNLQYEMELKRFEVEYYPNGMPLRFAAHVNIDGEQRMLEVNHPYSRGLGEDIYLTGYDRRNPAPDYCILQVVRQPWKYVIVVGIVMMLAGACLLFINGAKKEVQS